MLAGANAAALALSFLTTALIAREFGASAQMDAYTLAVSLPESLQYVLMLATLTVVFTPMFIEARAQHGEGEAWSMALSLVVLVVAFALAVMPLLALALPWLMVILAAGFAPATRALAVELSLLILPGLVYYATAGLLLGICYAYRDFSTAALNSLLLAGLNLLSFLVLVQFAHGGVRELMLGRLGALAALQLFLLWRVLRLKGALRLRLRLRHPAVWRMLTYLPPYMFGAVSGQLELIVNRSLISTLGPGNVAAWGYGQRLADIPIAVLGVAIGTTYLPDFASEVAAGRLDAARAHWQSAVMRVMFVLAPVAALLVALGAPLIAILFQRGAFDAAATHNTALVLAGLACGLPLRGVGGLIVRGLPAFHSRRLPLLLSALGTGASVALAFLLLGPLGLFGVALAASLGDILFVFAGARAFWRRLDGPAWSREVWPWLKLALATVAAGLVSVGVTQLPWAALTASTSLALIPQLVVGGTLGVLTFFVVTLVLRLEAAQAILALATGRTRWGRI